MCPHWDTAASGSQKPLSCSSETQSTFSLVVLKQGLNPHPIMEQHRYPEPPYHQPRSQEPVLAPQSLLLYLGSPCLMFHTVCLYAAALVTATESPPNLFHGREIPDSSFPWDSYNSFNLLRWGEMLTEVLMSQGCPRDQGCLYKELPRAHPSSAGMSGFPGAV